MIFKTQITRYYTIDQIPNPGSIMYHRSAHKGSYPVANGFTAYFCHVHTDDKRDYEDNNDDDESIGWLNVPRCRTV